MIEQLSRLPGVGRKSAERMAYHLLRVPVSEALALSDSIRHVRENVRYCDECFNLAESDRCNLCNDHSRDATQLCIVQQPRDLMALGMEPGPEIGEMLTKIENEWIESDFTLDRSTLLTGLQGRRRA